MTALVERFGFAVSQRVVAGLACLFIGMALVYGTGFAASGQIHNTAHDTRHAIGFPCH